MLETELRFCRRPKGREKCRSLSHGPPLHLLSSLPRARVKLLPHDAIPGQFASPSQSERCVGGLSVQLTLVNMREDGRDFEFPRPALRCHPLSPAALQSRRLSLSLSLCFAARGGGRERRSGKKEEWSKRGGTREEVDFSHSCHGASLTGLLPSSDSR